MTLDLEGEGIMARARAAKEKGGKKRRESCLLIDVGPCVWRRRYSGRLSAHSPALPRSSRNGPKRAHERHHLDNGICSSHVWKIRILVNPISTIEL
jgi:hypothetical protein